MRRRIFVGIAMLSLGCSNVPPDDDDVDMTSDPCEPGRTDDFALGTVVFDNPRWFRAFDEGCETIEMQTGLQGGWHVEPAVQAPRTASNSDLGGRILWTVFDQSGKAVADGEFELFRSFWQTLDGGDAYWGDFVIFDRNPEEHLGKLLTIECHLDFDDQSRLDDLTLRRTVTFVDDDPSPVFE